MRFTSDVAADGVRERLFTLGDIPGVLWTPADSAGPRPLVLLWHGGGQHKKFPGVVARARRCVTGGGFVVAAILQWDDELVPRDSGLALFGSFASDEKTLHANPGRHAEVPAFEMESAVRFFSRHLLTVT